MKRIILDHLIAHPGESFNALGLKHLNDVWGLQEILNALMELEIEQKVVAHIRECEIPDDTPENIFTRLVNCVYWAWKREGINPEVIGILKGSDRALSITEINAQLTPPLSGGMISDILYDLVALEKQGLVSHHADIPSEAVSDSQEFVYNTTRWQWVGGE